MLADSRDMWRFVWIFSQINCIESLPWQEFVCVVWSEICYVAEHWKVQNFVSNAPWFNTTDSEWACAPPAFSSTYPPCFSRLCIAGKLWYLKLLILLFLLCIWIFHSGETRPSLAPMCLCSLLQCNRLSVWDMHFGGARAGCNVGRVPRGGRYMAGCYRNTGLITFGSGYIRLCRYWCRP